MEIEKEFKEEYTKLENNLPSGSFSKRFVEQLCYRFYRLGKTSIKTKNVKGKESLEIIKKL
jgi:hypothetical protein